MQNGGKPLRNRPSLAQNRSESKFSWIFHQPMNKTNMHTWSYGLNKFWEKVPAFRKSHTFGAKTKKTLRITFFVFLRPFELTALLLKSFHLPIHCYTQALLGACRSRCPPASSLRSVLPLLYIFGSRSYLGRTKSKSKSKNRHGPSTAAKS